MRSTLPMHSKLESAPPSVSATKCATRSPPTSLGLTKCVMPNFSANALRLGFKSTPMILLAPTMRAPCTTFRPMPPKPNTTTIGARLHLRRVDDRADTRRHAAADVAHLVKGRVLADLRDGDFG